MNNSSPHRSPLLRNYYVQTALMLFVPLLLLWASRFAFVCHNADLVGNPSLGRLSSIAIGGGLRFDLCAWAYFNAAFIVMRLLPFRFVLRRGYRIAEAVVYCASNFAMLAVALGDIPFFRFTGSRLRLPAVRDILSDPDMGSILLSYVGQYWWAFLGGLLILALLIGVCLLCRSPRPIASTGKPWSTHALRTAILLAAAMLTFSAMRGSFGSGRPLAIADAVWYTQVPAETNIVLNTPFCLLRSAKGGTRIERLSFFPRAEAEAIRTSVHRPATPADSFLRKNVMIITLESGSLHWLDSFNDVPGGAPRGVMPFLDSIATRSLVNTHVLATGKRSIEGITAIYGGFPTFGEMLYMSSPYNANRVDSPARLLRDTQGYATRFYFGGNPGSYSIGALAKAMGFDDVADRATYANDRDYNGSWGIFDHAMAAYTARDLSSLTQPWAAGWFTIDLHAPFAVPDYWRPEGYRHPEAGLMRSAEYTDRALRHFFEIARSQSWFDNTLFIITGDHGCRDLKGSIYDGNYIQPHVMFIAYTPDGSIAPRRVTDRPMSQFDISPTLLGMLRYPRPYVAVGADMADDDAPHYALGYFNDQYQVTGSRYLVTLAPKLDRVDRVYDIVADPLLTKPLTDYDRAATDDMLRWAQAFMQDYTERLVTDTLHF